MNKYNPNEFAEKLVEKISDHKIRKCPFCGGESFTTTQSFATIMISEEMKNVSLGPNIPSGMIVCQNCGHIDFFALGALGMLSQEEGDDNVNK